jgi:hypothetical protein
VEGKEKACVNKITANERGEPDRLDALRGIVRARLDDRQDSLDVAEASG